MLDILEKIKDDECKYLKWEEFNKLSDWIAKTVNSTTRKQNRTTFIPHTFSDIDLPGTPAGAMCTLFGLSRPISKKLKSLVQDEEGSARYVKQLLIFYGVGVALYNRYYDDVITFSHEQSTYDLILYDINIYQWRMTVSPVLVFNFKLYGGDYYGQDYQINFLFDDSNYSVPAEINSIKVSIKAWLGAKGINYHGQIVISSINDELFKECAKDAIDEESKGRN